LVGAGQEQYVSSAAFGTQLEDLLDWITTGKRSVAGLTRCKCNVLATFWLRTETLQTALLQEDVPVASVRKIKTKEKRHLKESIT